MKQYKKELDKAKVESNFVKKKANNVFFFVVLGFSWILFINQLVICLFALFFVFVFVLAYSIIMYVSINVCIMYVYVRMSIK